MIDFVYLKYHFFICQRSLASNTKAYTGTESGKAVTESLFCFLILIVENKAYRKLLIRYRTCHLKYVNCSATTDVD